MSENSLSETYLNGMVHIIQPGDTPEYLEDLRKRGFITVSFKIDEAVENEYANVVVTSIDTTTDPNNYLYGPTMKPVPVDSDSFTPVSYVGVSEENNTVSTTETDTTVTDPADITVATEQEGTTIIQNHLYPGVKIHMVQYGETQEYLESLQDEGYLLGYNKDNPPEEGKLTISKPNPEPGTITVVANPTDTLPSILQDPAYTTVTDMTNTTDPNNYVEGPLSQSELEKLRIPDNVEWNTLSADTTVTDTTTPDTSVDPGSLDGPNPIGGGHHQYHFVQYGETQEYLESLVKEGYMMVYHEDNPPEEGKLTISKPNPEPEPGTITITFVANPTDTLPSILQDPADTTGADPAGLIAGMKSYLEEIAPKMSDIDSLTDEEVASFNETLKSFKEALRQAGVATYLADTTLDPRTDTGMNPETFDPRTDTSLNDLLDSYIAALDEKEAKTSDTTVTDTTTADTTDTEYYYEMDNWSVGENGELIYKDSTKYIKFTSTDLPFCLVSLDNRGRMMGDMDPPGQESTPPPVVTIEDLTPVLIPVSSELLQRFEEAKKLRQRFAERSNPIAFVSIMDAETAAVKSVQVACAEDDGWHEIGTLNNPDGIDWKYQAGNLTGSGTASVVWHAQELGALGVWTDGTDNWTGIAGWFDANWTMLGCGDFDGDGKDSVLMSLSGGFFYSVDLDGTLTSLGGLNWSGWEFGAVGDFAGDGKDDVVLFNKGLNCVVLLADGNADAWTSLGTIDSSDWSVAGVRDFNGDGIDDLLVRQTSTGIAGAYAGGDMNQWSVIDTTGEYYLA